MNKNKSTKVSVSEKSHNVIESAPSTAPIDELEVARIATKPAVMALAASSVRPYNLDAPFVASLVGNAWPAIEPYVSKMAELPGFDRALVTGVRAASMALLLVDGRIPRKSAPSASQLTEATNARRMLVSAAKPLADRGLLDSAIVDRATGGKGYLDVGHGLLMLASEFVAKWSKVDGQTVVTVSEIEHAQKLGHALLQSATPRSDRDDQAEALEDERARLATLVIEGWTEIRAALGWLRRREGDVNVIAPSLYARAGSGRKSDPEDRDEEPAKPAEDAKPAL
ncbi:MAG: hypothetical protein JNK05_31795 [Myxococcales bacterium]|nr:hypothetical protein [Myxococcales bacterium]